MACYLTGITMLPPYRCGFGREWVFRWSDAYNGKLYQLYIDGILADETKELDTRKELRAALRGKWVAQIIAIDSTDAGTDYSDSLDYSDDIGARVKLSWPRDPRVFGRASYCKVFWDAGSGAVEESTDAEINDTPIKNFPPATRTWGHFAGPLKDTRHAWGGPGVPWGKRVHGLGPARVGMDLVEFITRALPPGVYVFLVRHYDAAGNKDTGSSSRAVVTVDCMPTPPRSIAPVSYTAGVLTLLVTEGTEKNPYS